MNLRIDGSEKTVLLNAIEEEIDLLKKVKKLSLHQDEELTSLYDLQKRIERLEEKH